MILDWKPRLKMLNEEEILLQINSLKKQLRELTAEFPVMDMAHCIGTVNSISPIQTKDNATSENYHEESIRRLLQHIKATQNAELNWIKLCSSRKTQACYANTYWRKSKSTGKKYCPSAEQVISIQTG